MGGGALAGTLPGVSRPSSLIAAVLALVFARCDGPPAQRDARARPARAHTAPAGPPLVEERFASTALGVDKAALVVLPDGYATDARRYPVVYFLHGFGGSPEEWVDDAPAAARAAGLFAILVFVDGDDSFYVNWARAADHERCSVSPRPWGAVDPRDYCVRQGRYEQYVVRDVVGRIDARYRTIADRSGRALVGFSMGGFGALMLAMRNPDVFAAAVSHAGIDSLLYLGPRPYERGRVQRLRDPAACCRAEERLIPGIGDQLRGILGPDLANWRAHDPVALAGSLRDGQLALYLDCGTEDGFEFDDLAQDLHDTLEQRGIHHAFTLVPGGRHDGAYLRDRLDDGLRFVRDALPSASWSSHERR